MEDSLRLLTNIYTQAPVATRWIALVAGVLGLAGLTVACARAAYLYRVMKHVRAILGIMDRWGAGQAGEQEGRDLDDMWTELLAFRGPQAFRGMLYRMARARNRPVGLPEEAWRGAYEQVLGAESRWETLVRGIASATVLVGLLGTVVGFADISADLALVPGTPPAQTTPVESAVSNTAALLRNKLGGVFISTISGIFASLLILLAGAPILRRAADQWLGAVEDVGRLIVIPVLPRPLPDLHDRLVEELQRRISTVANAWESSLRGPAAALAELAESSRRSVEAVVRAFDGLRVSVEDLKELGNSAKRIRDASQSIEKTAKVYVGASDRLGVAVGSLEATLPPLSTDLRSLVEKLAGLEGVLGSGTRSVTESGDALRNAVTRLTGDFHGLQKAVASRHERESAFLEQTQRAVQGIEERLRGLQAVEQEIKTEAEQMRVAVSSVAIAIGDALDRLRETIPAAITGTFGKILKNLEHILVVAIGQSDETAKLIEGTRLALEDTRRVTADRSAGVTDERITEKGKELDHVYGGAERLISALNYLSDALDRSMRFGSLSSPKVEPSAAKGRDDGGGDLIGLIPHDVDEHPSVTSSASSLRKPADQPISTATPHSSLMDQMTNDKGLVEPASERPSAVMPPEVEAGDGSKTSPKVTDPVSTPIGVTQKQDHPAGKLEGQHQVTGEKPKHTIPEKPSAESRFVDPSGSSLARKGAASPTKAPLRQRPTSDPPQQNGFWKGLWATIRRLWV